MSNVSLKSEIIETSRTAISKLEQCDLGNQDFSKIASNLKTLLIGLVLGVGGFSLFLGALTQSVSWVASLLGVSLIPSILIGFLVVSLIVMFVGFKLLMSGKDKLISLIK